MRRSLRTAVRNSTTRCFYTAKSIPKRNFTSRGALSSGWAPAYTPVSNRPFSKHDLQDTNQIPGLTLKQKGLVEHWYDDFIEEDSVFVIEQINALAILVQAPVQPIYEYIEKKFVKSCTNTHSSGLLSPDLRSYPAHQGIQISLRANSFAENNQHLPAPIFGMVEKYVTACKRSRSQKDGRRAVNDGPFRCTFSCGYRTKRPYDWKRHEETHEPQELRLCNVCMLNAELNPFLVNRKDKFVRHAKDSHADWRAETVVEMSRVNFQPGFDPQCPLCPDRTDSWDERCHHILAHYDDRDVR